MQGCERKGTAVFPPTPLSWLAVVWPTTKSEHDLTWQGTPLYHVLHIQRKLRLKNTSISISQEPNHRWSKGHVRQGMMPGCLWMCLSHAWEELQELHKLLKIISSLVHLCWWSSERHWCLQTVLWVFVCVCTWAVIPSRHHCHILHKFLVMVHSLMTWVHIYTCNARI